MSSYKEYPISEETIIIVPAYEPGAIVRHVDDTNAIGTLVGIDPTTNRLWVYWSNEPDTWLDMGYGIKGFANMTFPVIRRVFSNTIANKLVKVQPMSLPHGLIFYMDYTYGSGSKDK